MTKYRLIHESNFNCDGERWFIERLEGDRWAYLGGSIDRSEEVVRRRFKKLLDPSVRTIIDTCEVET